VVQLAGQGLLQATQGLKLDLLKEWNELSIDQL
jgi:hypothetical protein